MNRTTERIALALISLVIGVAGGWHFNPDARRERGIRQQQAQVVATIEAMTRAENELMAIPKYQKMMEEMFPPIKRPE